MFFWWSEQFKCEKAAQNYETIKGANSFSTALYVWTACTSAVQVWPSVCIGFSVFPFFARLKMRSPKVLFVRFLTPVLSINLTLCRYLKDTKPKFNNVKSKKASSFHEFARSTNDAWNIDDEEDEEFLGTYNTTSSIQNQVPTIFLCQWAVKGMKLVWN